MIKGYCIICSDHFESSSNIAATPCGHTFHDVCLFRWLTQRSSSTNCPKCRFKLKRNDCIQKLYFDVSADQSFEHDEQEDCFALKNKIADLEITLRNRDVEIKKLVQNETSNKVELKLVNDYTCELQEANCDLESKLKFQLMKVKTMSKELSAHAKLRKEYEELKVEITLYKQHFKLFPMCAKYLLRNMFLGNSSFSSSCEDIDFMFKSFSTKTGLKDQAIICTMMKRELMNMKERNKEMKEKYSEISQKNISLLKENHYLKVASDTLKEDFEYNQRERLYLEKKVENGLPDTKHISNLSSQHRSVA
ncbi:E3 ubiquitin-protein ligase TRAIP [Nymphon striatum]|nr:E3 ubiquitin-protein ligase TRAIP [Nymphon striatum]